MYVTERAKWFKGEVAAACKELGITPTYKLVCVEMDLFLIPQSRIDTTNCDKVLLDAMQKQVLANDKQVYELYLHRNIVNDPSEERVEVIVSEYRGRRARLS